MARNMMDTGILERVPVSYPRPVTGARRGGMSIRPGTIGIHAGESRQDAESFAQALRESYAAYLAVESWQGPATGGDYATMESWDTAPVARVARTGPDYPAALVDRYSVPTADKPARTRTRARAATPAPQPIAPDPVPVPATCSACYGPADDGGRADYDPSTGMHASCATDDAPTADTVYSCGCAAGACLHMPTADPVPDPIQDAPTADAADPLGPCPRCKRTGWRSANGRAWHVANNAQCASVKRDGYTYAA